MKGLAFIDGYIVVVLVSGFGGTLGYLAVLAGAREINVWDELLAIQVGGLPLAALSFHFSSRFLLGRMPSILLQLVLLIGVEFGVGPFARLVVASPLTGSQGSAIVIAALAMAGAVIAWFAPVRQPRPRDERVVGHYRIGGGNRAQP